MGDNRELTARDIMTRDLVTVTVSTSLLDASTLILTHDVSGVLVVGGNGELLGILSEYDCLRALAMGEYHGERHHQVGRVGEAMTVPALTVPPERGLYSIADLLLRHRIRRLPVVSDGVLVGLVSRRDVLAGIRKTRLRDLDAASPTTAAERGGKGLFLSATGAESPADSPRFHAPGGRPRRRP